MAILRDLPYGNQHFRVDLGDGSDGPAAGFSHVILPDISIDVIEYRTGNDKESAPHKLPGTGALWQRDSPPRNHRLTEPLSVDQPSAQWRSESEAHRDD